MPRAPRPERRPVRTLRRGLLGAGLVLALLATPAAAQDDGGDCLTADPLPPAAAPVPIRFGITPLLAGSAGVSQIPPEPEDADAAQAALDDLRPPRRELVLRLNRMFMADGREGIRRYARIVDRYARAGFRTELQVRYHPPPELEGDMGAWREYVRTAVRVLGRRPSVTALSITNEANFSVSPNTSDGSYEGVRRAVVEGMVAADRERRRIGRRDIELGFSFAWRWIPSSDRSFWEEIGERATPEFRRAVDYVGLQVYPGLVWPPAPLPGRSAGEEIVEALTLLRDCYMPKAGLGDEVDLWVSENGYATNLGRSADSQRTDLLSTIEAVHAYSGELGITDYRYFNLRDNRSGGADLFDAVGVLTDDYERKPAFGVLRDGIAGHGVRPERTRSCLGRPVTLIGTPGDDRLEGGPGVDVLRGRGGDDRIIGGPGDDRICGGPGDDRISPGRGRDRIRD